MQEIKGILFHGTTDSFLQKRMDQCKRYESIERICTTTDVEEALGYAIANGYRFNAEGIVLVIKDMSYLARIENPKFWQADDLDYLLPDQFEAYNIGSVTHFNFEWLEDNGLLYEGDYFEGIRELEKFCVEQFGKIEDVACKIYPAYAKQRGLCGYKSKIGHLQVPDVFSEIDTWFSGLRFEWGRKGISI